MSGEAEPPPAFVFNLLDLSKNLNLFLASTSPFTTMIRSLSTNSNAVHPWWVSGFVDGEGCFSISILKNSELKTGWSVKATFSIHIHSNDLALLEKIKEYFGVGGITKSGKNLVQFRVSSLKDFTNVIIPHFDEFPLITQKRADYMLFKHIVEMLNRKEHLTPGGLQEIVNLRALLNIGLSDGLKAAFPDTIPVTRPTVEFSGIPDPH
jgi:hypothetical protein